MDIFISIRPTTIKFSNQVHLRELTQMRLVNQVMVTSSGQNHVTK